jgi:large repetitive protein
MWSRARNILAVHSLLAFLLLSFASCGGGSGSQPAEGAWQASPLKIVTTAPVSAKVGQSYNFQVLAIGGGPPLNWSVALGSLPPGVSLNTSTGVMAGTPTQLGQYSFTVEVTDSTFGGRQTSLQSLSLTVETGPLEIATPNLPDGVVGMPYHVHLQAAGGVLPYTWSILDGSLAPGVELDPLTGDITGTPTQVGTSNVIIQVNDSSAPQNFAKLILRQPEPAKQVNRSN